MCALPSLASLVEGALVDFLFGDGMLGVGEGAKKRRAWVPVKVKVSGFGDNDETHLSWHRRLSTGSALRPLSAIFGFFFVSFTSTPKKTLFAKATVDLRLTRTECDAASLPLGPFLTRALWLERFEG